MLSYNTVAVRTTLRMTWRMIERIIVNKVDSDREKRWGNIGRLYRAERGEDIEKEQIGSRRLKREMGKGYMGEGYRGGG